MQSIDWISCSGYRGFKDKQQLHLAKSNGSFGSGLTILVGPNGGGKSTIVECFRVLANPGATTFTEGRRNKSGNGKVEIAVSLNGSEGTLKTIERGGSSTTWAGAKPKISFLPSRRVFGPFFSSGTWDRETYHRKLPC